MIKEGCAVTKGWGVSLRTDIDLPLIQLNTSSRLHSFISANAMADLQTVPECCVASLNLCVYVCECANVCEWEGQ